MVTEPVTSSRSVPLPWRAIATRTRRSSRRPPRTRARQPYACGVVRGDCDDWGGVSGLGLTLKKKNRHGSPSKHATPRESKLEKARRCLAAACAPRPRPATRRRPRRPRRSPVGWGTRGGEKFWCFGFWLFFLGDAVDSGRIAPHPGSSEGARETPPRIGRGYVSRAKTTTTTELTSGSYPSASSASAVVSIPTEAPREAARTCRRPCRGCRSTT